MNPAGEEPLLWVALGVIVVWFVVEILPLSWWRADAVKRMVTHRLRAGFWCDHPARSRWAFERERSRPWWQWCHGCGRSWYERSGSHLVPFHRREEVGDVAD